MAIASRRVSYILPSPQESPPLLALPPLGHARQGQTTPSLIPKDGTNGLNLQSKNPFLSTSSTENGSSTPRSIDPSSQHPRHCLGVTSLVLDTSTILQNSQSPGGILYSGGRDGLVASWELNVPHKKRRGGRYDPGPGRGTKVKWERIGDGAELWDEEDEAEFGEDEEGNSSDEDSQGWVGLDRDGESRRRKGEVPYEDRWEVDKELLAQTKPKTTFRQSAQTHTDWVNDMILCNLNQTVVTASSDRTIRAWNPHASDASAFAPTMVGRHRDYVKALAWARHPSLLFSGALDRTLSVWDISGQSNGTPIFSIDLSKIADFDGVGFDGERGSVYALGVDPAGKVLAAGTPERVVRLWDPRAGNQSIGKLIGHSDCVRSIVLSDDGRYMLTGSSDATVKLWSLAAHRCLHTFDHHESSVWALHSNHPNLERFYSGSRDGYLCVTDVEQSTEISEGECVVLSREGDRELAGANSRESKSGDEGIRSIVSMDDEYVWTATGSADVKRWKDVGRRIERMEYDGASYGNGHLAGTDPSGSNFQPIPITENGNRHHRKHPSFDAGGHSPSEQQGLLFRTESRESRSVAFAPAPARPNGSSGIQGTDTPPRDRLSLPQANSLRRTSLSGAEVAGSVMSDSSAVEDGPGGGDGDEDDTMNGIPYASLVCLGMPESPYSYGFSRSNDFPPRPESVASGPKSMLQPSGGDQQQDGEQSPRRVSIQVDREASIHRSNHRHHSQARMDFEERELCSDAVPLRTSPDEVIAGRAGLVRSLMLNDRQHVITVDTEGEVAVWNIIRGICVGKFSSPDVAAALHLERGESAETAVRKHSNEVLEMVKERVEGETMVITWCQVDTKIGSLVVHLEEGRVFDAEVYVDDLKLAGSESARDDARVNLGKWVLTNLFRGLIKAEERTLRDLANTTGDAGAVASGETGGLTIPSGTRSPASKHMTIERPNQSPPHRQRAMSGTFTESNTVSLNIPGLVSPAATSAILPDIESPLIKTIPLSGSYQAFSAGGLRSGPLSAIPQSPATGSLAGGASPGDVLSRGDYFSPKRGSRATDPSPDRSQPATTPGANDRGSGNVEKPALGTTPGGSFMGKLKGFGKKKTAETALVPVIEPPPPPPEDTGPKFTEREQAQLNILDIVRAHSFNPPPPWEAPPLQFPPNTSLLVSEEAKDAGAWVVTYRSQVSSTERDLEALEMNSPLWLLDYLFTSRSKQKDPVKLTFILEPAPGSGLKEMPEGTTRLSASRVLRAKKIMAFIFDKLELGQRGRSGSIVSIDSRITPVMRGGTGAAGAASAGVGGGGGGGVAELPNSPPKHDSPFPIEGVHGPGATDTFAPEDVIELTCGMSVVDPKITLATLKHYYGSGGDMLLHYRLKEGVKVSK